MTFQELFKRAMKRELPPLIEDDQWGLAFDLGASGKYKVPGAKGLGLPDWEWPRDQIPATDGSTSSVHAYHFLEHLTGTDAISLLREIERVLALGGVFNFCMPYYNSNLMAQDLTHKSFWCEDSFRNLFDNQYYEPAGKWRLKVHFIIIAGIVERNLSLMGQLVKE